MKIKLEQIIKSVEGINFLLNMDLKIVTAFEIANISTKLTPYLKNYNIQINNLHTKYGEKQENNNFQIKKENVLCFNNENKELLEKEIDIDINLLNYNDFIKQSNDQNKIKPIFLVNLDWLFYKEEKEDQK